MSMPDRWTALEVELKELGSSSEDSELQTAAQCATMCAFFSTPSIRDPLVGFAKKLIQIRSGYTLGAEDAENVVQGVLTRMLEKRSFPRDNGFRPWIYSCIRNAVETYLKRERREPSSAAFSRALSLDAPGNAGATDSEAIAILKRRTLTTKVRDALERLSGKDRALLEMYYMEDVLDQEAGQLFGIEPTNVRKGRSRAAKRLKGILSRTQSEK